MNDVPDLAEILDRCLSEEELVQVAAAALLALGKDGFERLRTFLPAATYQTLERLSAPSPLKPATGAPDRPATPGSARVEQDWARLQERWEACVAETTDEKGDYVEQEHHWENPYFDVDRFAADLDRIAGDMEPLIPLLIEYRLEPDFSFIEAVEDAALEVGSGLPEWMDNLGGTGLAGAGLTRCVLQWERLSGRRAGEHAEDATAFQFLDRVRLAEEEAGNWSLCHGALADFVCGLPPEEQRGILAGLGQHRDQPHWAGVLADPGSGWFAMHERLLARFAPGEHAKLLRRSVSRDWRLAVPLLEEAITATEGSDWEETIARAVPALVGSRDETPWNPDSSLLSTRKGHHWLPETESRMVGRFLELWADLLRRAGRLAEAAVLDIQHHVWEEWEDWDPVLAAFDRATTVRPAVETEPLFQEWRYRVTERSRHDPGFHGNAVAKDASWVPLLVDAAREGPDGSAAFQCALRDWLARAGDSAEGFRSARAWLEALTADLDSDLRLADEAPFLHRALNPLQRESVLAKSRQTWLQRLGAADLHHEILKAWRSAPAQLLLDPASAMSSRYEEHARWLGVVLDLDPAVYRRTIRSWRLAHGRRRNLWQAIRALGLPLDD